MLIVMTSLLRHLVQFLYLRLCRLETSWNSIETSGICWIRHRHLKRTDQYLVWAHVRIAVTCHHLTKNKIGIFGKAAKLDVKLNEGDRVEIYRPLIADPKLVRKQRAEQGLKMKKGGWNICDSNHCLRIKTSPRSEAQISEFDMALKAMPRCTNHCWLNPVVQ